MQLRLWPLCPWLTPRTSTTTVCLSSLMTTLMKRLPNTTTYLLNSTLHGGKCSQATIDFVTRSSCSALRWLFRINFRSQLILTSISVSSGHCKKLTPEYEAAAEVLAAQDPPRTIAKVDATENKVIADRMQIKGFPTLFFYK